MLSTVEGADDASHTLETGSVFDKEDEQEQEGKDESSASEAARPAMAVPSDTTAPLVPELPIPEALLGGGSRMDACCGGSEESGPARRASENHCDEVLVFEELEKDVGSSDAVVLRTIVESVLEFVTLHILPIVEDSSELGKLGEGAPPTPATSHMKRFAIDLFEDAISDLFLAKDNDRCISPVLQRASQISGDCFPEAFDDALRDVAKRGCCRIPWALLRFIVVCKVHQIFENAPFPKRPHTPYPQREESLQPLRIALGHLWALKLAPFSVQRLAELLLSPRRHHKLARKLSYALVRIVGTVRIPLVHAIPSALSGLQNLLKSDEKLARALDAINPWPYTLSAGPQDFSTLLARPSLGFRLSCEALNSDSDDRRDSLDACSRTPSHGDPCWADAKDTLSSFSAGGTVSHPPQRRLRNSVEIFTPRRGVSCDRQLSPQGQSGTLRASREGHSKQELGLKPGGTSDEDEEGDVDDDPDDDDDSDRNARRSDTEGLGGVAESGNFFPALPSHTRQKAEPLIAGAASDVVGCRDLAMDETLLLETRDADVESGTSPVASPVFKKRRRVTAETEDEELPFDDGQHTTTPPSRQRRRLCSSGSSFTANHLTAGAAGGFSSSDNLSFAFLRDIAVNDDDDEDEDEDEGDEQQKGDVNQTTVVDNRREEAVSTHKEPSPINEESGSPSAHDARSEATGDAKSAEAAATSPAAVDKPNALAALLSLPVPETAQGKPPLFEHDLAEGEKMLFRGRKEPSSPEARSTSSSGDESAVPHNSCSVLLRDYFDDDFESCNGKKSDSELALPQLQTSEDIALP